MSSNRWGLPPLSSVTSVARGAAVSARGAAAASARSAAAFAARHIAAQHAQHQLITNQRKLKTSIDRQEGAENIRALLRQNKEWLLERTPDISPERSFLRYAAEKSKNRVFHDHAFQVLLEFCLPYAKELDGEPNETNKTKREQLINELISIFTDVNYNVYLILLLENESLFFGILTYTDGLQQTALLQQFSDVSKERKQALRGKFDEFLKDSPEKEEGPKKTDLIKLMDQYFPAPEKSRPSFHPFNLSEAEKDTQEAKQEEGEPILLKSSLYKKQGSRLIGLMIILGGLAISMAISPSLALAFFGFISSVILATHCYPLSRPFFSSSSSGKDKLMAHASSITATAPPPKMRS
jgi:hypothetical protein